MGEWEVDSCTGMNRRSLCVRLKKSVTNYLGLSLKGEFLNTLAGCKESMRNRQLRRVQWRPESSLASSGLTHGSFVCLELKKTQPE